MDKIDEKIISMLQNNARIPVKDIAAEVFLSSPAVSSRIEKLTKDGIIKGSHIDIDRTKIGYNITAYINVEMAPSSKTEFHEYIKSCPNVLECVNVTGQYSHLIKVAFKSISDLDIFHGKLQKYGRTSTQVVFSTQVEPRDISVTMK